MQCRVTGEPVFSVIIPVYNEEAYLGACVEAIRAQRGGFDPEIIVVDSCSTDRTAGLALMLGGRLVRASGAGVGRARREGTAQARGRYIIHVDADSRLPPDYLERTWQGFESDPALECLGGSVVFYDAPAWKNALRFFVQHALRFFARLVSGGKVGPMGNNMSFRKETYNKTRGFNPALRFGEDADLTKQLSAFGKIKVDHGLKCFISSRRYKMTFDLLFQFWNLVGICARGAPFKNELEHSEKL